ncbi:MAG: MBL fold metallo-hydrolase [Alicyclobacillus sp.]|nr:MBL fold metallo-hydrolase [Alicyclobacillus sp.]
MDIVPVASGVHLLPGAVNMGLVESDDGLVAVDTGLDKQSAKRIIQAAETLGRPVVAIFNTHAHADHFGGNAHLLKRFPQARVFAPWGDAPIVEQPLLEPQYLWYGAQPFAALQNKFLLASPSPVHERIRPGSTFTIHGVDFATIDLPGHAHGQVGVRVNGVLFAADAYFGRTVTDKHGLPYMVDYRRTLESAEQILRTSADCYVPGHGAPVSNPQPEVTHLQERHRQAFATVHHLLRDALSVDELTAQMCDAFHLAPASPSAWVLLRTTVAAYVAAAVDGGSVAATIDRGVLVFHAVTSV